MKRILAVAFLFALPFLRVLAAQQAVVTWQGSMQAGTEQHRAVLQMSKTDKGEWQPANFYIEFFPEDIRIDSSHSDAVHLRFTANNGKGVFEGSVSTRGDEIIGSWRYGKSTLPVELKRTESAQAWQVPFLYQYHYKNVTYYRPSPDEPKIPFSAEQALNYLEQGAIAWTNEWHCVACHTNGSYMVVRPMLTSHFGAPQKELHDYFITALHEQMAPDPHDPKWQQEPTQVVYIAAGLAIWDANVTHLPSPETAQALDLMFKLQRQSGDWYIDDDNNPPLESKTFQLATVAARAVANAPGWLAAQQGTPNEAHIRRLEELLRSAHNVQGDYDRTDLLWTATEYPGLLDAKRMSELTTMILNHQQPDGGWSIRTFAGPRNGAKAIARKSFGKNRSFSIRRATGT